MMKLLLKIFLILLLLVVIAGISFLKTSRSSRNEESARESIKIEYAKTMDSLHVLQLDKNFQYYSDSINRLDEYYQFQIDSLNCYFADRESELITQMEIMKPGNTKKESPSETENDTSQESLVAQKIVSDYNSALKSLPADLTSYEKKVAFNEIKVELSKKYKISPDSLKKIIKI